MSAASPEAKDALPCQALLFPAALLLPTCAKRHMSIRERVSDQTRKKKPLAYNAPLPAVSCCTVPAPASSWLWYSRVCTAPCPGLLSAAGHRDIAPHSGFPEPSPLTLPTPPAAHEKPPSNCHKVLISQSGRRGYALRALQPLPRLGINCAAAILRTNATLLLPLRLF
jgi:hypothetical protein